jgi:hypothetical protein
MRLSLSEFETFGEGLPEIGAAVTPLANRCYGPRLPTELTGKHIMSAKQKIDRKYRVIDRIV